jgi:hypothetical protein
VRAIASAQDRAPVTFDVVFGNTRAIDIHGPQIVLGYWIILLGAFAIPTGSFSKVLSYTLSLHTQPMNNRFDTAFVLRHSPVSLKLPDCTARFPAHHPIQWTRIVSFGEQRRLDLLHQRIDRPGRLFPGSRFRPTLSASPGICSRCHAGPPPCNSCNPPPPQFVTESVSIRRLLDHIGEPSIPPRISPCRGPPEWDETVGPVFIEDVPQPDFEYQFDQTISRQSSTPLSSTAPEPRMEAVGPNAGCHSPDLRGLANSSAFLLFHRVSAASHGRRTQSQRGARRLRSPFAGPILPSKRG